MVLSGLSLATCLSGTLLLQSAPPRSHPRTGILEGTVLALPDSLPVADALVRVEGRGVAKITDGRAPMNDGNPVTLPGRLAVS